MSSDDYNFQWSRNRVPIPGANGPTLKLPARPELSTEQWLPELPVKGPDYKNISCDFSDGPSKTAWSIATLRKDGKLNDVSEIPADRMKQMQDHFAQLKKKWPKMKDERIAKKVAEHFKIKLV